MVASRSIQLAVVLAVVGCTSADVLRFDQAPRPHSRPEAVRLLGQEPTQPYRVIALVSVRNELIFGNARARLLKEAARLGGDAVLLGIGSVTHVGNGEYGSKLQLSGKVIVFDRGAPAAESPR